MAGGRGWAWSVKSLNAGVCCCKYDHNKSGVTALQNKLENRQYVDG